MGVSSQVMFRRYTTQKWPKLEDTTAKLDILVFLIDLCISE